MAHVEKYKLAGVAAIIGEHERTPETCAWRWAKEPGTDMYLDRDRLSCNYTIGREVDMLRVVDEAVAEHNSNGRRFRSDGVALAEWVVTLPPDWPRDRDPRELWDATLEFARERYGGADNVPIGYVHMDEGRPHMHVPVIPRIDGRMRVRDMVTPADMNTFHDDLERYVSHELGMDRVGLRLTDEEREERTARYVDLPRYKEAQRGLERAEHETEQARQRLEVVRLREREAQTKNRELNSRADGLERELELARERARELEGQKQEAEKKERTLKAEHSRLAQIRERIERGINELKRGVERLRARLEVVREQVREHRDPVGYAREQLDRLSKPLAQLDRIDERLAQIRDDDPGVPAADALRKAEAERDKAREALMSAVKERDRLVTLDSRSAEIEKKIGRLSEHKLRNRAEIKEAKAELEQAKKERPSWGEVQIAAGKVEKAEAALESAERRLAGAPAAIEEQRETHERLQAEARELTAEREQLKPDDLERERDEAMERYYALDDHERGQVALAMIQREPDGYMAREVVMERIEELAHEPWALDYGETDERDEVGDLLVRMGGEDCMEELADRRGLSDFAWGQIAQALEAARRPSIERATRAAESYNLAREHECEQPAMQRSMGQSL